VKKQKEINPFVVDKKIYVIELLKKSRLKSKDNSEIHSYSETYKVDREYCSKLYRSKENQKTIFSLSNSGLKLLLYILMHIQRKTDTIELLPEKIELITKMKKDSFNRARSELVKNKIIMKTKGRARIYWVNPHFIFNGNRSNFYKNNIEILAKQNTKMPKNILKSSYKEANPQ